MTKAELAEYALPTQAKIFGAIKQACPLADSGGLSLDAFKYNKCVHENLVFAIVGTTMVSTHADHILSDRIESLESQVLELMIWRGIHHD